MTSDYDQTLRRLNFPRTFVLLGMFAIVLIVWVNRDRIQPVVPGNPAPEFEIANLDGDIVRLSDYRGRVVMVNIWATWCVPCRYEMPSMERLYQKFSDEGLEILAVSIDSEFGSSDYLGRLGGDIREFADSLGLTFPILHDPSGGIQQAYQTTGVPETFVIGRDGIIYKKVAGGTEWDAPDHQDLIWRLLSVTE